MKKKGFLRQKQYVIAGTLVIIAAIGTTVLYSNKQEKEREQLEAELAEEMNQQSDPEELAAVEDTEQSAEASAVIPPKETEEDSTQTAEVAQETETTEMTETTETAAEAAQTVEETAGTGQALSFFGGRRADVADGGKCHHQLQYGFYCVFSDS